MCLLPRLKYTAATSSAVSYFLDTHQNGSDFGEISNQYDDIELQDNEHESTDPNQQWIHQISLERINHSHHIILRVLFLWRQKRTSLIGIKYQNLDLGLQERKEAPDRDDQHIHVKPL